MAKLVIFGGRDFYDFDRMCEVIESRDYFKAGLITTVVSGTAGGADKTGERFAAKHGIQIQRVPADWDAIEGVEDRLIGTRKDGSKFYKLAGFDRNEQMATISEYGEGFWDGESHGTYHMIGCCEQEGVILGITRYFKPIKNLTLCHVSKLKDLDVVTKAAITRKKVESADVQWVPELAPSRDLFEWWMANERSAAEKWDDYVEAWDAEKAKDTVYWAKIDRIRLGLTKGVTIALACFCVDENLCHRSLVRRDIINGDSSMLFKGKE